MSPIRDTAAVPSPAPPALIERSPARRRLVVAAVATIVVGQLVVLLFGAFDPAHRFGFQPFNESSTIRADIVRVTVDGRRVPITDPWPGGYEWDALMGWGVLEQPHVRKHAFSSAATVIGYYEEALDWVAGHTPGDHETRYLEATVHVIRNTRPEEPVVLRSVDRERPP